MPDPLTVLEPFSPVHGRIYQPSAVAQAASLWANATTNPTSPRRMDLLRDKQAAVVSFFALIQKHPGDVSPRDVQCWQEQLAEQGLAPTTVYSRVSRVSSFYGWLQSQPELAAQIPINPARLARPKAPHPYQNRSVQALDDATVAALLQVVRDRADAGDIVGKRDYALLVLFFLTGLRRHEVLSLCWSDLRWGQTLELRTRFKGGDYRTMEVADPVVGAAIRDYLESSGRLGEMKKDSPVWARHDHACCPHEPLSSHAFAKNLKQYAKHIGLESIHVHQTRHTFARMVGESTGSLTEVQDALGHKNLGTTRVYLPQVAVKRDRFSSVIAARLRLPR